MLPRSHKVLLEMLTGLTKKLSDQRIQQRMSRKVESRKWDSFDLAFGRIHMTSRNVYFPLKQRDHLAVIQPDVIQLIVLLLCQSLLNCSSSFIFLCYNQNNVSKRDITNFTGIPKNHQNKYKYMELAISET